MLVEFQFFPEKNRTLAIVDMPEVPVSGELVQIDDQSYRVRGRGWVLSSTSGAGVSRSAVAWVMLVPWGAE